MLLSQRNTFAWTGECFFFLQSLSQVEIFHRYTEAVMVARPSIYISLAELTDTHQLLLDHRFLVLGMDQKIFNVI